MCKREKKKITKPETKKKKKKLVPVRDAPPVPVKAKKKKKINFVVRDPTTGLTNAEAASLLAPLPKEPKKPRTKAKEPKKLVKPDVMKRIQKKVAKLGKEKVAEKVKVGKKIEKVAKKMPTSRVRKKALEAFNSNPALKTFTEKLSKEKRVIKGSVTPREIGMGRLQAAYLQLISDMAIRTGRASFARAGERKIKARVQPSPQKIMAYLKKFDFEKFQAGK